jgi:hypothetical protein
MGIETAAAFLPALGSVAPALQTATGVLGAFGAYRSSQGAKDAYGAQAQVAENNAQIAQWQADDALARGAKAATATRVKTLQLEGDQRAALAANGVDLTVGSAADILRDSDYFGKIDANTVTDNAAREAWGHRMQGANFKGDALNLRNRADVESPWAAAGTSLLGSANRVASGWYTTNKKPAVDDSSDPLGTFIRRGRRGSGD